MRGKENKLMVMEIRVGRTNRMTIKIEWLS